MSIFSLEIGIKQQTYYGHQITSTIVKIGKDPGDLFRDNVKESFTESS